MPTKKIVESKTMECNSCQGKHFHSSNNPGNVVYSIGLFGAAYYFFSQAVGVSGFFLAILKTIIWPALLVYQALILLKL